jgi:hypothetical protein
VKFAFPVGVVIERAYGPAVTLLPTVILADMLEPSGEKLVIEALIPAGAVIPVTPRKFCPVMVTGVVAPWGMAAGDILVNTGVTVMFEDAPRAIPVVLA